MSLANFGERQPAVNSARQGKKMLGGAVRPLSPSRITRAKGRDTLLEDELKTMAAGVKERGEENFLHFGLERSEAKLGGKGRGGGRDLDSDVFGGPKPNAVPHMRLRPDLPENELKKIHPGDNTKKADVAANMAKADTMLDKMYSNNYPLPRKNEEGVRGKRGIKDRQVVGSPVDPEFTVEGFSGMGAHTHDHVGHRQGISMQPKELKVVAPIPTAGAVNRKHNFNPVSGAAPGEKLNGNYETNTSASFKPY